MKKIIVFLMLLFSMTLFGAKFTTNGKDNFDKLKGSWRIAGLFVIEQKNGSWYCTLYPEGEGEEEEEEGPRKHRMVSLGNGGFVLEGEEPDGYYYGYDTRLKKFVLVYDGEVAAEGYRE